MKIEMNNGFFAYHKESPVLQNVNFEVNEHEILSILGPNGAGKTTLLKCVLGFQKLQKGHVLFDGQDRRTIKSNLFWQKCAYVPQAKQSAFPYTVQETVLLGRNSYLSLFQKPQKKDIEICEKAMQMAGIIHLKDRICSEISGGELQLVLIARALCTEPEVLVLDEPETGLDFKNQTVILNLIRSLKKTYHLSIIFNTHYPEHALDISDRTLLLMKDGCSLFGMTDEILTENNMRKAFGVEIALLEEEIQGRKYHAMIPLASEKEKE